MDREKYALILRPLDKAPLTIADEHAKARLVGLHSELKRLADGLKREQSEHRQRIQAKLEASLKDAEKDSERYEAVRTYEKDYESGFWNNLKTLKDRLERHVCSMGAFVLKPSAQYAPHQFTVCGSVMVGPAQTVASGTGWAAIAKAKPQMTEDTLAVVYVGDNRFIKWDQQPKGAKNVVLLHRSTGAHFVQDRFNRFVRRFQTRAINDHDLKMIQQKKSNPISPKHSGMGVTQEELAKYGQDLGLKSGEDLDIPTAVFMHLQQGDKRFVSLTSTKYPIYGNSGASFVDYGLVSVDLALLEKDKIVDVHDPRSINDLLKMDDKAIKESMSGQNTQDIFKKAARDVVRTREVLVFGDIPLSAITPFGLGQDAKIDYPVDAAAVWK